MTATDVTETSGKRGPVCLSLGGGPDSVPGPGGPKPAADWGLFPAGAGVRGSNWHRQRTPGPVRDAARGMGARSPQPAGLLDLPGGLRSPVLSGAQGVRTRHGADARARRRGRHVCDRAVGQRLRTGWRRSHAAAGRGWRRASPSPLSRLTRRTRGARPSSCSTVGETQTTSCLSTTSNAGVSPTTLATEDGSRGVSGRVTLALEQRLQGSRARDKLSILACGPTPMLRAVRRLALDYGVAAKLCLEESMACGFGVCLGCAVPVYGSQALPLLLRGWPRVRCAGRFGGRDCPRPRLRLWRASLAAPDHDGVGLLRLRSAVCGLHRCQ